MASGETLVLVPGLACTQDLFGAQIGALSTSHDIHVADVSRDASISEMAARILDDVPGPLALLGLSMGGYVAFEVVRQAAKRVTRLALLDTTAAPDDGPTRGRRRDLMELARMDRLDEVHAAQWPRLVSPHSRSNRLLEASVRKMLEQTGSEIFIRQQMAIMSRRDSREVLAVIQVPTLVLVGEQDCITPVAAASEMAAGVAAAELVVLPDTGHLSTMKSAAEVTASLGSWLRR